MIARRIACVACVALFLAFVMACGGSGPVGVDDTQATKASRSEAKSRPPADPFRRWSDYVTTARAERTERLKADLESAENELSSAKASLDDAKKKVKTAPTVKKESEYKKQITEQTAALGQASVKVDRARGALKTADTWEPRTAPNDLRAGDLTKLGVENGLVPIFTVFQVIGPSSALLSFREEIYWVEGIGTSNLADGRTITLHGLVECTGNKQYTSAIGATRTVMAFKYHGEK